MSELFFRAPLIGLPRVSDAERVAEEIVNLHARAADADDSGLAPWVRATMDDPAARELLGSIFSNSPFLTRCIVSDIPFLKELMTRGPDTALGRVIAHLKDDLDQATEPDRLMRELRVARRRVALLVALADLVGLWPLERITQALSDFADVALSAAISHLLWRAAENGDLVLADEVFPEIDCGYVALAMGKHGARELNYSSDIDLIVLYEPMKIDYRGRKSPQEAMVRMTQRLAAILQERTADGYVCRVDLRLRPDPGATPVAISCAAARAYYAERGESWERAAMIKARSAAGDTALGRALLGDLTSFVWREPLDFWTLREIQAIKRRINVHRGSGEVAVLGHNIKLGRGGIREIEFFAQTQQLIFGGRDPYLRCERTLDALSHMAEAGRIEERTADELSEAYEFLRQLEHRLQMVDDQQTQTLPSDDLGLARIAAFMAFDGIESFRDAVLHHLRRVEAHYGGLFDAPVGPGGEAAVGFTLDQPDEQAEELLRRHGFRDGPEAIRRLRRWHEPSFRARWDERSRELLVELLPRIVESTARMTDPDRVLESFESFLLGVRASRGLLSLLAANPGLLDLLVEILAAAPALAATLRRRPELLQFALSEGFFSLLPERRLLMAEVAELTRDAGEPQEVLERMVPWCHDHQLQIAVQALRHTIDSTQAGQAFCDLADAVVRRMFHHLSADLPVAAMAVVALGPWGTRQLTHRRPLDILFITDDHDGAVSLPVILARRLTTALGAPTAWGRLYPIDLDATPWGGPGPLVTPLEALREFCAGPGAAGARSMLIQARVVAGPAEFTDRVAAALDQILCTKRPGEAAPADVSTSAARRGIAGARHPRHRAGGLDTLEDLVRAVQLRHAPDHPQVLEPSPARALAKLAATGVMAPATVRHLLEAHHLLRQMETLIDVAIDGVFDWQGAPEGLKSALVRAGGAADLASLQASLEAAGETVLAELASLPD